MVTDLKTDTSHITGQAWLPRPVAILVAARAVNQLGAFSLPFLAVLLVQHFDADLATAGLVVATFGLATIPSRLAGALVTRRIGARATIVRGLTLCAIAQIGIAIAPSLAVALAAVTLLGLAYEVYEPASQSLIAELTAPEHRPRAFSLFGAALALGGVAGALLATVVGGIDLHGLFILDAATCLTCAVVVRVALPDHRVQNRPGMVARPWRDRRLLVMHGLGTCFATIYLQLRIALPLTLIARGVPGSRYGLVLVVSSLVVVLAQPVLSTRLVRQWLGNPLGADPFRAMAVGWVVLAIGLAATGLVTSLLGFLLVTVVWALGDVLLLGHPFAVVADLAPPGASASYLAAYGTCWGIAAVIAPLVGTGVLAHGGPTVLWLGCGMASLALAGVQPMARRWVSRTLPDRLNHPPSATSRRRMIT